MLSAEAIQQQKSSIHIAKLSQQPKQCGNSQTSGTR